MHNGIPGSPINQDVLRMLLGELSDDGMGIDPPLPPSDQLHRPHAATVPPAVDRMELVIPPLSNEEQLRLLRHQLEEQQQMLNRLQRDQGAVGTTGRGAGRGGRGGNQKNSIKAASSEARRAARKAATEKHRAEVAELEGRLSSISSVHTALAAENGMLRRRLVLLESGVQVPRSYSFDHLLVLKPDSALPHPPNPDARAAH